MQEEDCPDFCIYFSLLFFLFFVRKLSFSLSFSYTLPLLHTPFLEVVTLITVEQNPNSSLMSFPSKHETIILLTWRFFSFVLESDSWHSFWIVTQEEEGVPPLPTLTLMTGEHRHHHHHHLHDRHNEVDDDDGEGIELERKRRGKMSRSSSRVSNFCASHSGKKREKTGSIDRKSGKNIPSHHRHDDDHHHQQLLLLHSYKHHSGENH